MTAPTLPTREQAREALNRKAFSRNIAHPEWMSDAVADLRRTLELHERRPFPNAITEFMLSTPAHRLLRSIYGGYWSVAWWALRVAFSNLRLRLTPLWWLIIREGADKP